MVRKLPIIAVALIALIGIVANAPPGNACSKNGMTLTVYMHTVSPPMLDLSSNSHLAIPDQMDGILTGEESNIAIVNPMSDDGDDGGYVLHSSTRALQIEANHDGVNNRIEVVTARTAPMTALMAKAEEGNSPTIGHTEVTPTARNGVRSSGVAQATLHLLC